MMLVENNFSEILKKICRICLVEIIWIVTFYLFEILYSKIKNPTSFCIFNH